jgi:poly(3-hydroxybutyrate) depolymerase
MKIAALLVIGALLPVLSPASVGGPAASVHVTVEAKKSVLVVETLPLGTTVTAIAVKLSHAEKFGDGVAATKAFEFFEEGKPRSLASGYTNSSPARSSTPRRGTWLILTVHQHPVHPGTTDISQTYALQQISDLSFPDSTLHATGQAFGLINTVNPLVDRYTFNQFSKPGFEPLHYRMFQPTASKTTRWPTVLYPLVLTLHGYGEAGEDNRIQLEANQLSTAFAAPSWQKTHPAFVVSPQIIDGDDPAWIGTHVQNSLLALIAQLESEYPIDKSRVYIVGLSIGSFGAWQLAEKSQSTFAAAIFDSGGGYTYSIAPMAHFPLWNVQSLDDDTVSYFTSIDAAKALTQAGATVIHHQYPGNLPLPQAEAAAQAEWNAAKKAHTNTLFTSFAAGTTGMPGEPTVGPHGSWIDLFRNPVYLRWLFSQHKPGLSLPLGFGGQ